MPTKPPNKTCTVPGLGGHDAAVPSRPASTKVERVREPSAPPVRRGVRDSVRREDPDDEPPKVSSKPSGRPSKAMTRQAPKSKSWKPEATTGTRRKYEGPNRPPVQVDEVGAAAVKIARGGIRESGAPKLAASRAMIAQAPIDSRSAFVLSLIDGRNTVDSLIDTAAMPEAELRTILARLERLGLITLG
jgi:hypothetical protein